MSGTEQNIFKQPIFADLRGRKILIAEDNAVNLQLLYALLAPTEGNVIGVKNGKALLDAYHQDKPDLILTDVKMPGMDGVEACKALREIDQTIPIIAVTANIMPLDIENYCQSGFTDCISKPILAAELYQTIDKVMKTAK